MRSSRDDHIASHVYINADLTSTEAKIAFEHRVPEENVNSENLELKIARAILLYRHPCVATEPIIFYLCLFFYSPFVLRNYSTDSHQIFRDCVLSDGGSN